MSNQQGFRSLSTFKKELHRLKSLFATVPVDSTGLKFLGEGEWKRKKHGPEYRRQWRKLHVSSN